jgi:hypothetical protein
MLITIVLIDIAARDAASILRGSILSMRIPITIEAGIAEIEGAEIRNPISTYEILRSLIIWYAKAAGAITLAVPSDVEIKSVGNISRIDLEPCIIDPHLC